MPMYGYTCPANHTHDLLARFDARPEASPCPTCAQPATYRIGAPAPGIVTGSRNPLRAQAPSRDGFTVLEETESFVLREKGTSLTRADYECREGHRFGDDYTEKPATPPACPDCGAPAAEIIAGVASLDWFTQDHPFGYFDPALGVFLTSAAHRRQVMKEQGVVEMEWGGAMEQQLRDRAVRAEQEDEEVRRMLHGYKHGPDAATMHRKADEDPDMDWRKYADALGVE